ncbi:PstC family ABC transporter permease [Georgenia sp. Z1344]|uniref:PstC family ABC transporter permease n=1 Tax=Georgenia sp. Z1344 TaxID=3416706 RepID=UPI003CEE4E6A
MSEAVTTSAPPAERPPSKRVDGGKVRTGDRVFNGLSFAAGAVIIAVLGAVALFLLLQSIPALTSSSEDVAAAAPFTSGNGFWAYAGITIFGTLLASIIALIIAVPFAIAISLFISHYAPRRMSSALGYVIDLLAAIPSVVFGLWGMRLLEPLLRPAFTWVSETFTPVLEWIAGNWGDSELGQDPEQWYGGLPGFSYMAENFEWWPISPFLFDFTPPARNILMGGLILAIMILPIITSLCREVFLQTPRLQEEASLALGATRWEMIKQTVLPFGRSGMVSASMLGLGRALGETMALLMVLSPGLAVNFWLMSPGQHATIASQIALSFPEAHATGDPVAGQDVLIAIGLMLFILTFVVNYISRAIVARYAEFSGANA